MRNRSLVTCLILLTGSALLNGAVVWTQSTELEAPGIGGVVLDEGANFGNWEFDLNQDGHSDILFKPLGGEWSLLNGAEALVDQDEGRLAILNETFSVDAGSEGVNWAGGDVSLFTTRTWNDLGSPGLITHGLALQTNDGIQYAWFRYSLFELVGPSQTRPVTMGVVFDYAYETEISVPILTPTNIPEPSAYALIALGGILITFLRRRKKPRH